MGFIGWLAGWAFILYLVDKFLHRDDVPFVPLSETPEVPRNHVDSNLLDDED